MKFRKPVTSIWPAVTNRRLTVPTSCACILRRVDSRGTPAHAAHAHPARVHAPTTIVVNAAASGVI
jgi:hypothetical protein